MDGGMVGDGGSANGSACCDPKSGLTWERVAPGQKSRYTAKSYCAALTQNGWSDWRLPSISELRSLIRGCPATQSGGICGVTDSCLGINCWKSCDGCEAERRCKWDTALMSEMCGSYWSSSSYAGDTTYAWSVDFSYGCVYDVFKTNTYNARCVRGP